MEEIMSDALFVCMVCFKTLQIVTTTPGFPYPSYITNPSDKSKKKKKEEEKMVFGSKGVGVLPKEPLKTPQKMYFGSKGEIEAPPPPPPRVCAWLAIP